MDLFGIDIGSETVKVIQLKKEGLKFRLIGAGMGKTPENVLSSESEKDLISLVEMIKKLKVDAGIQTVKVAASLPENSVFTHVVELPVMKEEEVEQALKWELEDIIPLPLKEVNYDWQILRTMSDKVLVLVSAAPKILIEKYLHLFELSGFELVSLETEALAITRALSTYAAYGGEKTKMIIDFGSNATDIIIVKNEEILLIRSIPTAGKAITRAIASDLAIEEGTAEEYKKTYGLGKEQFEGKLSNVISSLLTVVITEIKKSLGFLKEEKREDVRMIILSGGSANLPDLSELIAKETGLEVQIADPFSQLIFDEQVIGQVRKFAPNFVVAVGLAMKEV